MSEINMKDAPRGYIAVKPTDYLADGRGSCYACELNDTDCGRIANARCLGSIRGDGQDVIFKTVEEKERE